jgi:hypothetical protein
MRLQWPALAFIIAFVSALAPTSAAWAFNSFSHDRITRNAIRHLRHYPHVAAKTATWLNTPDLMVESLVRANVDTDFKADVWLDSITTPPIAGAKGKGRFVLLTSMLHFLNVTTNGAFWEHDGYSYRGSTKQGADTYLNMVTVTVRGDLSSALGGTRPEGHAHHGSELGTFDLGFGGTSKDWKKMFGVGNRASKAVFPPSNVPSELAFQNLLVSPRAAQDRVDSWEETFPVVRSVITHGKVHRKHWRGEVQGLPVALDQLGLILHMVQDLGIPQHAQGTSDLCHGELEDFASKTGGDYNNDTLKRYWDGTYEGEVSPQEDSLYDADLTETFRTELPFLNPTSDLTIKERMIALGKLTSQWRFKRVARKLWTTTLPDRTVVSARTCAALVQLPRVREQLRANYNLSVAASAAFFELAVHHYERAMSIEQPFPLSLSLPAPISSR